MQYKRICYLAAMVFITYFIDRQSLVGKCEAQNPIEPPIAPVSRDELPSIRDAIEAHLGYVTDYCMDEYGEKETGLWLGRIDIRTSKLANGNTPVAKNKKSEFWGRSNLYLDQPTMVAALEFGRLTGCKCYQESITRYLQDQAKAVSAEVINPYYEGLNRDYDLIADKFVASEKNHLLRFFVPAWEIFFYESKDFTVRAIDELSESSMGLIEELLAEKKKGAYEHQVFTKSICDRSIALSSITWLAENVDNVSPKIQRRAEKIVLHSLEQRQRFETLSSRALTVWINALITMQRSGKLKTNEKALTSFLPIFASNPPEGLARSLDVVLHEHEAPDSTQQPADRIDRSLIDILAYGETCIRAWGISNEPSFLKQAGSCADWVATLLEDQSIPLKNAESYGRVIHFLTHYSQHSEHKQYHALASEVGQEAMELFYEPRMGMFRSRPDIDECDARDGPGFLLLGLLTLLGNDPTDSSALIF